MRRRCRSCCHAKSSHRDYGARLCRAKADTCPCQGWMPSKRRPQRRDDRGDRGVVLLEFALALPIFLFLILAGADLLWFEQQAVTLSYVATQAAVCQAEVSPAPSCDPTAWAKSAASGLLLDPSAMQVAADPAAHSVTIRYDARALTGFLRPMVMTRTAVTP